MLLAISHSVYIIIFEGRFKYMAKFYEVLKYLRTSRNVTQAELAKVIGVSASTIGMYETGEREPNFEIEEKIADYFNVSLDILRGKKEQNVDIIIEKDKMRLVLEKLSQNNQEKLLEYALFLLQQQDKGGTE